MNFSDSKPAPVVRRPFARLVMSQLTVIALLMAGCEDHKASSSSASSSAAPSGVVASPGATSAAAAAQRPASATTRSGKWSVVAPGRGTAYEVEASEAAVKLEFGGNFFEGASIEGGRRYTSKEGKVYTFSATPEGLALLDKDGKKLWTIRIDATTVTVTDVDKAEEVTSIATTGGEIVVKKGDELLGKVLADGDGVKVTDAAGTAKYTGKDKPIAAWGVLLIKGREPMRRLVFTELLARGR